MLTLKNVCKTFDPKTPNEKAALKNFNLHLDRGEFVTVIGSNGAGKSTVMNAISGKFMIDSGSIVLDGEDITFKKDYLRARDIGRLFQDPLSGTAPHMTIEENLLLAYTSADKRRVFGISSKDRDFLRQKLHELDLGLEDRLNSQVGQLSGGQRQALTLLMATLNVPKLLLLDEHTAALDPATAEKVLELTKNVVAKNNITCMMITHNMRSSLEQGNRTIMMDDGKIVLDIADGERKSMTVKDLLERFHIAAAKELDNDRMMLD